MFILIDLTAFCYLLLLFFTGTPTWLGRALKPTPLTLAPGSRSAPLIPLPWNMHSSNSAGDLLTNSNPSNSTTTTTTKASSTSFWHSSSGTVNSSLRMFDPIANTNSNSGSLPPSNQGGNRSNGTNASPPIGGGGGARALASMFE